LPEKAAMFQLLDFYSNELTPSVKHAKKEENNSGLQVNFPHSYFSFFKARLDLICCFEICLQGIRSLVTHMGPPDHMKGVWYPGMTGATARQNYEMAHCMGYC
jgi:hypothetical protein